MRSFAPFETSPGKANGLVLLLTEQYADFDFSRRQRKGPAGRLPVAGRGRLANGPCWCCCLFLTGDRLSRR